ncbi:hypothetical protein G6514_003184 [Epicoccum nigrum]|nr:hypothetical protein G6514_003184 [Epicoccum nigrum]
MSSKEAPPYNPTSFSNPTPSANQGEDSDPDSPPAPSLTPSSPDTRSPRPPLLSPMPDWEDVESNINDNNGDRYYTEFSPLLKRMQRSFRGSLQSEYGTVDTESSVGFTDEEYETDDETSPGWTRLSLDTSGWDTQSATMVILIFLVLVVSGIAVLVRIF